MGVKDFFTKGQSYDQTFSLFDLFRGQGGRQSPNDQQGFIFVDQSGRTNSGESVTVDNLLEEATVVSCVNAITQGINQIPVYVKRESADGNFEIMKSHPISKLMRRPNDYQTAVEFKSSIVTSMLIHGNAFIYIVRAGMAGGDTGKPLSNTRGRAAQLYPLEPSDITIGSNALGRPSYSHEEYGTIPTENIIHIRDLTTFVPQGLSRALLAAEIIGAKKAADSLMSEAFRNGANLNYVVSSDVPLDATKLTNMQKQMKSAFGQRGNRNGGAMFIEQGTVEAIKGLTPADVDLRELREQLIREIAAVFRVPAFMVGADAGSTYNNVRQYWTAFHRDTLSPILKNIEDAITLKLLDGDDYLCFDIQEIIKGDIDVTSKVAALMVSNGMWTPNDGRTYAGST